MSETHSRTAYDSIRSLQARAIAIQLIKDHIVKKPLRIDKDYIYGVVETRRFVKLRPRTKNDAPVIWYPPNIERDVWERAVAKFIPDNHIFENVHRYLIPELEPIEHLSEDKLIELIMSIFSSLSVMGTPIRKDIYYFDENGVYRCLDTNAPHYDKMDGGPLFSLPDMADLGYEFTAADIQIWKQAARNFQVGMTLEECLRIYISTELSPQPPKYSFIDRFVQRINLPKIEREPGNQDKKTFDYIRVQVNLARYMFPTKEELRDAVKANRKEIDKKVLEKIANYKSFQRFGVPVNVLKVSDIVLRSDASLEYIFELKKI